MVDRASNGVMLVLDEAHLYQGALGTEVGLLVRIAEQFGNTRLRTKIVQFILCFSITRGR